MSDHLTREELRHDEVGEALERGVQYVADNWKRILIGAGMLALVVLAVAFWMQQRQARAERGAYALHQAVSGLDATDGGSVDGSSLDAVVDQYGGATGRMARLYQATLADAEQAELWQQAEGSGVDAISVVATTNRVHQLRATEQYEEALAILQGGSLPEDLRLYEAALTQQAAGLSEDLQSTIVELADQFPNSPLTAEVSNLLESD